jgi:hypothetical protein
MVRFLDKQVRNRISSIQSQEDRRYNGCMTCWFGSR